MQNMLALLGAIGIVLGIALKDYASGLVAGIVAVGERPYRNGDWIEINGICGEAKHIGMRSASRHAGRYGRLHPAYQNLERTDSERQQRDARAAMLGQFLFAPGS